MKIYKVFYTSTAMNTALKTAMNTAMSKAITAKACAGMKSYDPYAQAYWPECTQQMIRMHRED